MNTQKIVSGLNSVSLDECLLGATTNQRRLTLTVVEGEANWFEVVRLTGIERADNFGKRILLKGESETKNCPITLSFDPTNGHGDVVSRN